MNQEASTVLRPCSALLALRFGRGEAESNPRTRTRRSPSENSQTRLTTTGFSSLRSEKRAAARADEEPDVEHDVPFDDSWPPEAERPLDDEGVPNVDVPWRDEHDRRYTEAWLALTRLPKVSLGHLVQRRSAVLFDQGGGVPPFALPPALSPDDRATHSGGIVHEAPA